MYKRKENAFEPVWRSGRERLLQEARAAPRDEHRERRENGTFLFGVADASVGRANCRGRSSRVGRLERRPGVSGSAEQRRKRTKPEDPRSLRGFADVSCLAPRLRGITPPARETRVSEWLSLVSRVPVALLRRLEARFPKLESAPDTTSVVATRREILRFSQRAISVYTLSFLSRERTSFELFDSMLDSRQISTRDPGDVGQKGGDFSRGR